ncbi:MAG: DUF4367 domain-containing protein [Eubacteriales bacterium]
MDSNDKSEQLMKAYYAYIGQYHVDNIIEELDEKSEEIKNIQVPPSLDQWFEKTKKQWEKKEKNKLRKQRIMVISKRVVVVLLVLLSSLSILTISVEAFREKVLDIFMERTDTYSHVRVDENLGEDKIEGWEDYYVPAYIPEDFKIESAEDMTMSKIITFKNRNNDVIQFAQCPLGTDFQFDTENAKVTEVEIQGYTGMLSEKDNKNILFWYNDKKCFYLLSGIDPKMMIKMAESVEKK